MKDTSTTKTLYRSPPPKNIGPPHRKHTHLIRAIPKISCLEILENHQLQQSASRSKSRSRSRSLKKRKSNKVGNPINTRIFCTKDSLNNKVVINHYIKEQNPSNYLSISQVNLKTNPDKIVILDKFVTINHKIPKVKALFPNFLQKRNLFRNLTMIKTRLS